MTSMTWSPTGSPNVSTYNMENSILPRQPSSPFDSELDFRNREASRNWATTNGELSTRNKRDTVIFHSPSKVIPIAEFDMGDQENMPADCYSGPPQDPPHKKYALVREAYSSMNLARDASLSRSGSSDSERMPPPPLTTRSGHTPMRSPLKPVQNLAHAPPPARRGNSQSDSLTSARSSIRSTFDVTDGPVLQPQDHGIDDTWISTFSEAPDMKHFEKTATSPAKSPFRTPKASMNQDTRSSRKRASPSRSPSPTPRRMKTPASQSGDGTTFLIDFTQQMEGAGTSRVQSPSKSSTESNLLSYINRQRSPNKTMKSFATPQKSNNILNLLDFELPPAPTPRSIPTITVRELEGLKSSYLSQISSLKATLSGREAEVDSLKRAISDAERRVGDAQEALGTEKSRREDAEQEKDGWEKRGKEVEAVLMNVKDEVIKSEAEKEDMLKKLEEYERRLEEAEHRAVKAEQRCSEALSARSVVENASGIDVDEQVQKLVAIQIDAKIEAVSRELHGVYKEKHERKVATLKKSYEARGEKKCAELRVKLANLEKQHEELVNSKDATFSGPLDNEQSDSAELKVQVEEHKASLARLESELGTFREQREQLTEELRQERIEKGELVAAVDEMLALQHDQTSANLGASVAAGAAMSMVEDFRKSIRDTRPSGLRTPAAGRFGLQSALPKSSGLPGKSRMLANIERMGSRVGSASSIE